MVFLGFTIGDEETAALFAQRNLMPWPIAFGAATFIDALGTAEPAVFVVSAEGRILWNDGSSRSKHDTELLARELEDVIEDALHSPAGAPSTEKTD